MALYTLKNGSYCVIDHVTPDDAPELVNYVNQIASETDNMTFGAGEYSMSVDDKVHYIWATTRRRTSLCLVARVNGKIVGNLNLQGSDKERLQHTSTFGISVLQEYWGQGIGKLLMEEMMTHAVKVGLTKINLKTRTDNVNAIALYHRFGFEVEGIERRAMRINGKYVDFLMMGLLLD